MKPITNKRQMYELLRSRRLGNQFLIWESVEDFERSAYNGLCGVRCADKPGSPYFHQLSREEARECALILKDDGYTPVIYQCFSDSFITIQGEVEDRPGGLYLFYSTLKTHMRGALRQEPRHATGIEALAILRWAMGEASLDDIRELLELYPGHVVEFSAYEVEVGVLRGRRHVCWECRGSY